MPLSLRSSRTTSWNGTETQTETTMSSYDEGKASREIGYPVENPYKPLMLGDREDRIHREVQRRRWEAGYNNKPDPYPNGYAG